MFELLKNYLQVLFSLFRTKIQIVDRDNSILMSNNSYLKGILDFKNTNFFECEISTILPQLVFRNSIQTILDTGHKPDKNFALTVRTYRTKPYFQIAWIVNGSVLTKTLYFGKFAHIKFGFDLDKSLMWLDIGGKNTTKISNNNKFNQLEYIFGSQSTERVNLLKNIKRKIK